MKARLEPEVERWLEYLREVGFEDLPGAPRSATQRAEVGPEPVTTPELSTTGLSSTGPPATGRPGTGESEQPREGGLEALCSEAEGCTRCRLSETRQSVVFADGDPSGDLMFVGEGPGAEEDRRGLPFVGAAGQLLDKIISAMGFQRRSVYIANIVKCRPPGNRDPEPDEVAECVGYLHRQIDLVQPRVIVALGRVAAQNLLGTSEALGRLRGRWHEVRGVPVYVTYHPAALLRNAGFKRPAWEDMQVVRDRLAEVE